jgi:CDP-diacylglycerol--glycerol-3-phosphate 3-phosphatidyltransferase
MSLKEILTLPNILTLIRLILSPIMLPVLLVYLLPLNIFWINCLLAGLFFLFSITDFFDGFLARRYGLVSSFGRFLDPIADKFLMFSTFVALLAINKIFFVIVLICIGREFFVLGLRQMALEHQFSVPVSWLGKIKTLFQVFYLTVVILNPCHTLSYHGISRVVRDMYHAPGWTSLETLLMIIVVIMTLMSAQQYYRSFLVSLARLNNNQKQ